MTSLPTATATATATATETPATPATASRADQKNILQPTAISTTDSLSSKTLTDHPIDVGTLVTTMMESLTLEQQPDIKSVKSTPSTISPDEGTSSPLLPHPSPSDSTSLPLLTPQDGFPVKPSTGNSSMQHPQSTIYVGSLACIVNEVTIHQLFDSFGPITAIKIFPSRASANGFTFSYAFVQFLKPLSAAAAIEQMQGKTISGTVITVNWAYRRQQPNNSSPTSASSSPRDVKGTADTCQSHGALMPLASGTVSQQPSPSCLASESESETHRLPHLFVGDLAPGVNEEILQKAFAVFGPVTETRIMWDHHTGRSRGYGFVAFEKIEDATRALHDMNGVCLCSRPVRCNWATEKSNTPRLNVSMAKYESILTQADPFCNEVYLGNLAPFTTKAHILPVAQRYGFVLDIRVMPERGYAFVTYSTHESAAIAIMYLQQSQSINGRIVNAQWGKTISANLPFYLPQQQPPSSQAYPAFINVTSDRHRVPLDVLHHHPAQHLQHLQALYPLSHLYRQQQQHSHHHHHHHRQHVILPTFASPRPPVDIHREFSMAPVVYTPPAFSALGIHSGREEMNSSPYTFHQVDARPPWMDHLASLPLTQVPTAAPAPADVVSGMVTDLAENVAHNMGTRFGFSVSPGRVDAQDATRSVVDGTVTSASNSLADVCGNGVDSRNRVHSKRKSMTKNTFGVSRLYPKQQKQPKKHSPQ